MERKKVAVFVGRMCPLHVGHQSVIDAMIDDVGIANVLIILGSVAQKVTYRVLFSYHQRRDWIRRVYVNEPRIIGIPDFPNDNDSWMDLVMDLVDSVFWEKLNITHNVVFYGGSHDDIELFHNKGFETKIVERTKVPVSATVIRDMMLRGLDVSDFIDGDIHDDVKKKFAKVMEESEKWESPF